MWRVLKHGGNSMESKIEQLQDLLEDEWDGISGCDWELNKTRSPPESVREYFEMIQTETCEDLPWLYLDSFMLLFVLDVFSGCI